MKPEAIALLTACVGAWLVGYGFGLLVNVIRVQYERWTS